MTIPEQVVQAANKAYWTETADVSVKMRAALTAALPFMGVGVKDGANLTRPLIGIENRTAQEVFDIMCDRIRSALIASDHGDYRRGLEDAARVCDAGAEKRAKQYEDWPKDQFVQKERFRVGAQQSKILAAAIRSLSPDSQPAPAPAPAFWLVHSKGGFPFGLFKTEEEAKNNLLRNPLRVITPLYTAPVSQPAPAEREWLPIESAPRDGTGVDLYVRPYNGKARRIIDCWWTDITGWRDGKGRLDKGFRITHFRLPSTPAGGGE